MSSEISTNVEILVSLFLVGGAGGGPTAADDSGLVSDDLLDVSEHVDSGLLAVGGGGGAVVGLDKEGAPGGGQLGLTTLG